MGEDTENPSAAALSGDQRQLYPNRRAQPLQRLGDGQRVELTHHPAAEAMPKRRHDDHHQD